MRYVTRKLHIRIGEQTLAAVLDQARDAGHLHRHNRKPGTPRLERGDAERLTNRREHEHIARRQHRPDLRGRPATGELNLLTQTVTRDSALEARALGPVADDAESHGP